MPGRGGRVRTSRGQLLDPTSVCNQRQLLTAPDFEIFHNEHGAHHGAHHGSAQGCATRPLPEPTTDPHRLTDLNIDRSQHPPT